MATLSKAEIADRLSAVANDLEALRADLAFPVAAHLPITHAVLDRLEAAIVQIREPIGDDTLLGSTVLDDIDGLTDAQRAALGGAGIHTADDVRNATDEQLAAVNGIGPTTVQKLRDATRTIELTEPAVPPMA